VQRVRLGEQERRNDCFEGVTRQIMHLVSPSHFSARRFQDRTAGVLEEAAGTHDRLFSYHTRTADLLDLTHAVRDDPVTTQQLDDPAAFVVNANGVGEDVLTGQRQRVLRTVVAASADPNAIGDCKRCPFCDKAKV